MSIIKKNIFFKVFYLNAKRKCTSSYKGWNIELKQEEISGSVEAIWTILCVLRKGEPCGKMLLVWGSAFHPTAAVRGQRMRHRQNRGGEVGEDWRNIQQETGINRLSVCLGQLTSR